MLCRIRLAFFGLLTCLDCLLMSYGIRLVQCRTFPDEIRLIKCRTLLKLSDFFRNEYVTGGQGPSNKAIVYLFVVFIISVALVTVVLLWLNTFVYHIKLCKHRL